MIVNRSAEASHVDHINIVERYDRGIFSSNSKPEMRHIQDRDELVRYVEALKTVGMSIVLTSGTFDLVHVGHSRYLETARSHGDILIVGVDSDEKVRQRKGPTRPVVPQDERIQMLSHLRAVDLVTIKESDEPRWNLIKQVKPNTLIVTRETYDNETLIELQEYCDRVVVLPPQATTSTSAQIRRLQIGWSVDIVDPLKEITDYPELPKGIKRKLGSIIKKIDPEN